MVWGRIARAGSSAARAGGFRLEFPTWNPFRAAPVEPPLGVGPTEEIFGRLGSAGPPAPSPRIELPFVESQPPRLLYEEPTAPVARAEPVSPGYAENYELLYRLGVPPSELGRTSPYADAREAWNFVHTGRKRVVGFDEYDEPIIQDTRRRRLSSPWLRSSRQRIQSLEKILERPVVGTDAAGLPIYGKSYDFAPYYERTIGPDGEAIFRRGVGRDIDATFITRTRWDNSQQQLITETVPLRKIYEERLRAELGGAARWWIRDKKLGGPGFEKEFEWLAIKDPATNERVAVELLDDSGNRIVVPTAKLDINDPDQIFVFGSNLEGIHGAGAAKEAAEKWGAQRGVGEGLTGRAYAFPTKRVPTNVKRQFQVFELENYFDELVKVANANPTKKFMFTPVGTGLAGYDVEEIATIIARVAAKQELPPNIIFTDVNEKAAERFAAKIVEARKNIAEEFVTVDVDELVKLERQFFGEGGISTKPKPEKIPDLPALPAPSILEYAGQESSLSSLIDQVVRSGDESQIAAIQALTYLRLQNASTPRAIVSALKDFRKIEPTLKKNSPMRIGFRDAIENRMESIGALNKQAAADTYVYLAEEVVDAKKLASYIDGYISDAKTFDELLRARFWLDDVFVASKLSHPELLARGYWSRLESRLIGEIENRIVTLRSRAKKYYKPQGTQLIKYESGMSDDNLRKMLSEAIGTARSLDELRVINAMIRKLEVSKTFYDDLAVMIRAVRPIVASRRKMPVRGKDLRRTRIKELSSFAFGKDADASVRSAGVKMTGEEPRYSDIVGWEYGKISARYEPYNPASMEFGATMDQKKWIAEESADFVEKLRSTLDMRELANLRSIALFMKREGKLSGRMWRFLSKELDKRDELLRAYYKRSGIPTPEEMSKEADKVDLSSVIAWANANRGARREATRYWNDPDIASRDDLSDFVQSNPLYDELMHDAQILDSAAGRTVRGLSDNEMLNNPFLEFDDAIGGSISIARGDISEEIIRNTNRRYFEIQDQIDSTEKYLKQGTDYLGRNIDTETIRVPELDSNGKAIKGKYREITYRQYYTERLNTLAKQQVSVQIADQAWYNDMGESGYPFGVTRMVDPTNPTESALFGFDFETGFWYRITNEEMASRRASNKEIITDKKNLSEAIFPEPSARTKVYESGKRLYVDANGKQFEVEPLVRMYVPDGHGYEYRTFINAYGSDATVSAAVDFDTAGEKLTKRFATGGVLRWDRLNGKYAGTIGNGKRTRFIAVDHNADDFEAAVNKIVDQLNETYRLKNDNPLTVNFAGNGMKTLVNNNVTQADADAFAYRLMRAVMESPRRRFVIANARTGGQSGYDQAFMKALIKLEIPIDVTLPRARYGKKVMVQNSFGETQYVTMQEYLLGIGFQRPALDVPFSALRDPSPGQKLPGQGVSWGKEIDTDVPIFEVSTQGTPKGKRYSAFNAKLRGRGGKSIEDIYQVDIKGGKKIGPGKYTMKGSNYKGPLSNEELYARYKQLWVEFFEENPKMLDEIAELTEGKMIVDRFAYSPVNQARAIFEILSERGMWRGLGSAATSSAPSSALKAMQISTDLPAPKNSKPWKMSFRDSASMPMSPENRGKSTMELIAEGKRTATTRSTNYNVKVGDVIDFVDDSGNVLRVEVTKAPYQLPEPTDAIRRRWSELEGWDPSVYDKYVGQWQFQYRLLGRVK